MTAKQVTRFIENGDSTAIHYRRFNLSPKDVYPTFSICFTGSDLYWNRAEAIFQKFGLSPSMFESMLKGKDAFSYQYNYTLMLYNKIPVDMKDYLNDVDTGTLSLKISDILTGLEYDTNHKNTSIHYGSGRVGTRVDKIPLQVGYNTSDTVCYTRESNDSMEDLRTYDWLSFNKSVFGNERYKDVDLQVFVHHPKQLMRSFHRPVFRSKLGFEKRFDNTHTDFETAFPVASQLFKTDFWTKFLKNDFWSKLLKITISKVRVLRKRPGSNVGCDERLLDDDTKFKEQLIKHINCTPVFWRPHDLPQKVCKSKADLQNAESAIREYKAILASYGTPCTQMEAFSRFDREEENEWDNPRVMIMYEDREYEEIQNYQDFDVESFVSGVGGFIGIFLGYSILQLPEVLGSLVSLMSKGR